MKLCGSVVLLAGLLLTGASSQSLGAHVVLQSSPSATVRTYANYSVRTITANRVQVHEYVSTSGVLFGVAWQGPSVPDLRQYLGSHYAAFQAALNSRKGPRRGPLLIQVDGLVVENAGQMRALHGRAYLVSAIPNGLTPAVIQ